MFNAADGLALQRCVRMATMGTAVVELGAWCGRSLASICEVVPDRVEVYSYDNYLEDSQAVGETPDGEKAPITPQVACNLREHVRKHYAAFTKISTVICDSTKGGELYEGPLVSVLLVDDHHSAEKIEANLAMWLPNCAMDCMLLFHDYGHKPYGIEAVCERVLPGEGFRFLGQPSNSGLGVWSRGWVAP